MGLFPFHKKHQDGQETKYPPPAYPPPNYPPPPLNIPFPRISEIDRVDFPLQGWAAVELDDPQDALLSSFQSLIAAGKLFFDLPQTEKEKYKNLRAGPEAGWSRCEGEKELITLREDTDSTLPHVLREPAKQCWTACGSYINDMLGMIAQTLGLQPEALTAFSEPCIGLKPSKTATMLRLFRYEGGQEPKIVAEPHTDIGLLSLVFGDKPGLEVFDRRLDSWYSIEQLFTRPTASVLVGKQLFHLTNSRYHPGAHRVVSSANPPPSDQNTPPTPNYRYSIVFILRAHSPVPIDTSALTTPFTGPFVLPMTGMIADDLYKEISRNCFNINIDPEIRKAQKERMRKRAEEAAAKSAEEAAVKTDQAKDGEHSTELNSLATLGGGETCTLPSTSTL